MHLESHESADDRQYYDYHMDRNGHSLHGDEQGLTPTKMKEPKLPTAEETLSQAYKATGWRFDLSVLPTGCPHESLALKAIESHTAAHTAALRERVKELEAENNLLCQFNEGDKVDFLFKLSNDDPDCDFGTIYKIHSADFVVVRPYRSRTYLRCALTELQHTNELLKS